MDLEPMTQFREPERLSKADERAVAERDLAWVANVRAGDRAAFDAMFGTYYERLCVFAAGIVASDAVAEEIVQDTFLRIWRQRENWAVPTTVASYLYRAVRNRAIGHLRHQHVEERGRLKIPTSRPARPDEELHETELARAIERAMTTLPPRCREAFLLRRQHGLSYVEIAETMGIAAKTVEVQIGAALRALRVALREWLP